MEQKPISGGANSEFAFSPTNKVVGFIDDTDDAKAALRDLRAAGFSADEVDVLTGEEGAQRIDATGEGPAAVIHTLRSTQELPDFYDAPGLARAVKEQLVAGRFGIGVIAKNPRARERAREILKSHHGHFINFYGGWAVEALEP